MSQRQDDGLHELLERLSGLLEQVDALDDHVRETVYATLDTADELHRRGLRRLGDALDPDTLARLRDGYPTLGWLLDAYGVGADQLAAAQAAVEDLRPHLESRGGHADVLDVTDGVVHLRLGGACAGSADAPQLREELDRGLHAHVPGFVRIAADEEPAQPEPTKTLLQIQPRPPDGRRDDDRAADDHHAERR